MLYYVFLHADNHWYISWQNEAGEGFDRTRFPTLADAVDEARSRNPSAAIYHRLSDGRLVPVEGY